MLSFVKYTVTLIIFVLNYVYYFAFQPQHQQILNAITVQFNYALSKNRSYYPNQEFNVLRIIQESDYCQRSDAYKFMHPDIMLEDTYTLVEIEDLPREILRRKTFEALPQLVFTPSSSSKKSNLRLPLALAHYQAYFTDFQLSFTSGKSALCMFQKYNHSPGKKQLSQKENLMNNYFIQLDKLKSINASKQCIDNATFIPKTYRLFLEAECREFFAFASTEQYLKETREQGPAYICKQGGIVHRGKGIFVLFENNLKDFLQYYQKGELCGQNETQMIAQRYITNPYLYKKHKIEFRIYWLLASTNPFILYSYKRPLIKRCALPFDLLSKQKASHVCNTAIVRSLITDDSHKKVIPSTMDHEQIEEEEFFIDWNFEGLQDRLIMEGKIQNQTWLHEILYPRIYTKLIHQFKSARKRFTADSRFSEFFATDFIMNDDLEIFVLETNANPQILSVTSDRVQRNYKMVMDTVNIQNCYLKSRYIRIRRIIQQMIQLRQTAITPNVMEALIDAYKDRLEPGIKLDSDNLYHKVIDMNNRGPKAYNYLLEQECIY